jgi:allantoicase
MKPVSNESRHGLIDLLNERVGGRALMANDEFFAGRENLVREAAPVFDPDAYTDKGKLMDGWETRRRREEGYDWCILRLGIPGRITRFVVDTAFFRGNYPEHCSIEGCVADEVASAEWLANEAEWQTLVESSPLEGDHANVFEVSECPRVTHLRLNIFPDGGVARFRAFGVAVPDWNELRSRGQVDLGALANGGVAVQCSDMFFSDMNNLLRPGASRNMGDGWETKRRRGPGYDWVVVRLGTPGLLERIVVDTSHFKGNAPARCEIDVLPTSVNAEGASDINGLDGWQSLAEMPLLPDDLHERRIADASECGYVRMKIHPDGGVARLRLFGRPRDA